MRANAAATLVLEMSFAILMPAAARAQTPPGIVGEWLLKSDQMEVESIYGADGAYTCHIRPAGGPARTVTGKYTLEGAKLRVRIDGRGQPATYAWALRGADTLELTDEKGNTSRMDRRLGAKPIDKPDIRSPIVGEWLLRNEQLEFRLTLDGDGTFDRATRAGGREEKLHGTWKLDGERCELSGEDGKKFPFKWRLIEPGRLELKGDDGSALQLVRVGGEPGPMPGPPPGPADRKNSVFGPTWGVPHQPPPADQAMPDYMKPIAPDLAKLKRSASGHILYINVQRVKLGADTVVPSAKMHIMAGDGADKAPFISPPGLAFTWHPSWSADGKKVAFASNFEQTRSGQYIDLFLADLETGRARRMTGVEAWAPVKGRGTLIVTVVDDTLGPGAIFDPNQVNVAVQTCDGKLYKLQEVRKQEEGSPYPAYFVMIPNCPAGTIWVKAWSNRFIGDVASIVLPVDGKEECVLHLSGGNYMSTTPQLTPDGRYLIYVAERAQHVRVRRPDWANPNAPPPAIPFQGYSTLAALDTKLCAGLIEWPGARLGVAVDPKLSPDGQMIAFSLGHIMRQCIAVCPLKSFLAGEFAHTVLVRNEDFATPQAAGGVGNCQPAWSPDGKRIAFVRYVMSTKAYRGNIFVVNADGAGLAAVTELAANQLPAWPTWSPDGKRIAFQLRTGKGPVIDPADVDFRATASDIWSIRVDGSDARQLTDDGISGEPNWGP